MALQPNVVQGDLRVYGSVTPDSLNAPASSIGNTAFNGSDPLATTKYNKRIYPGLRQAGTAVSAHVVVHYARAAGTVTAVRAGSIVACVGAATIVVNVKKNGTTILTGTFTLDNTNTAFIVESGTILSGAYVAGDVLSVDVTATAGGGTLGTGLFVELDCEEGP